MKKLILLCIFAFCLMYNIFAADLALTIDDLLIEPDPAGGLNLFIRKKGDINSVLLCETTKDPNGVMANYSFRDTQKNAVNGNEVRKLDDRMLTAEETRYSIISSSVKTHPVFGHAFHLYLPKTMEYGYPWTRNGSQVIEDGLFVNIRTFTLAYADYDGEFKDNPFMLNTSEIETKMLEHFNPKTVGAFKNLAQLGTGQMQFSEKPSDLAEKARKTMFAGKDKKLDLVFVIDATMSMNDDMLALRKDLIASIKDTLADFDDYRIGLVIFKDYGDELKYKDLPVKLFDFTSDLDVLQKNLNGFRVSGGGDIEEAVHEGLFAAMEFYPWREDASRRITLIGDAEPHSTPRGTKKYTAQLVKDTIAEKQIQLNTIILFDPDRKF